jgi:hypothetical protein
MAILDKTAEIVKLHFIYVSAAKYIPSRKKIYVVWLGIINSEIGFTVRDTTPKFLGKLIKNGMDSKCICINDTALLRTVRAVA